MRVPNGVLAAKCSDKWIGFRSPVTAAKPTTSEEATVLVSRSVIPTAKSSKYRIRNSNISNRSSPNVLRLFPEIGVGKHKQRNFTPAGYDKLYKQIADRQEANSIVRPPSLRLARIVTQPALIPQPRYNIGPTPARFRCPWCIVLKSSLHSPAHRQLRSRPMTTRHAACSCGRLTLRLRANQI